MLKTRSRFILPALLLALLLSGPATAAADNGVLQATLDNGLRVVIIRSDLAPVVTAQVNYLVGSNDAPEGFPGMAHAQEHMMFRGSPGLSAAQFANIMALVGGEFDAFTTQIVTQYAFTVPREDFDVALNVEAARMGGVLNAQDLWEQERGAVEQEVAQNLSNPEYILYSRIIAELFHGTPYALDALGTRPSLQKTTAAMLKTFYGRWYGPNNAVLVIAGDVDPPKTLAVVRELFGPIPPRLLPPRAGIKLRPAAPAAIAFETDLPYGIAAVAYRLPGSDSPDFAAGQILLDVLDSRRGSLYALVSKGKALRTSFEGGTLPKASYGYATAAFPPGGDGRALVAEIKGIVADYIKNGIPAELVEAAKRREAADAEFQKNSVADLATAWSQALAAEGRTSPQDDLTAMAGVTVEDVNRVLREYFVNDTAVTAVLTPGQSGKQVPVKGFGGKESFAPREVKPVALPEWARRAAELPALPASSIKPSDMTLDNGIRLIVQTGNVSSAVSLFGRMKSHADLDEPEGKEGTADILESLFPYGTTSLDLTAFQKAQDDIGATIAAGANFSLRVLSPDFERGVELLAENLLKPALPEAAFAVVKEETVGALKGKLQSPAHLSQRALRESLYPRDDPSLRQALPETVSKITLADVKAYHAKAFRPDMTTIVVVGNVTREQAKAAVEKYFGSWKAKGPKPDTSLPPIPPNKASAARIADASKVQDQVTLAETLGLARMHPDYYRLQIANQVLSGAFYASRLYQDLREKAGLVYSVDSFIEAKHDRSFFGITFACDPENVARAGAMVGANIRAMQKENLSAGELHLAKTQLVKQIPLSESGTDRIAEGLLARASEDLPLDEPLLAAAYYRDATADEVREAFARWIRPDDFVQVTVGPDR